MLGITCLLGIYQKLSLIVIYYSITSNLVKTHRYEILHPVSCFCLLSQ